MVGAPSGPTTAEVNWTDESTSEASEVLTDKYLL